MDETDELLFSPIFQAFSLIAVFNTLRTTIAITPRAGRAIAEVSICDDIRLLSNELRDCFSENGIELWRLET